MATTTDRVERTRAIIRLHAALEAQVPVLSTETIERIARALELLEPEREQADRAA